MEFRISVQPRTGDQVGCVEVEGVFCSFQI